MNSVTAQAPKLRFPEFRDEWQEKTLEQVVNVTSGQSPDGRTYNSVGDGLPLYQGKKDFGSMITTTSGVWTTEPVKTAEKLDVLLSVRAPVGDINYAGEKMAIGRGLTAIKPKNEFIVREFLFALLLRYHRKLKDLSSGSTFEAISASDIKKVKVCLPSIQESQKIAEFLTAVDEKVDLMRQKVELLKKYKKGVMQKVFSQQIRFSNADGKDFPKWDEKELGELVTIKTGKKDVDEGNPRGLFPFFTCAKTHTFSDTWSFDGAAILIAGNAEVGLCKYFEGKFEAYQRTYVLQDFALNSNFLFMYLAHFFRRYALGLKQTGAMSYIKLETLHDYLVPIPSEVEQQKIADFLTAIDEKIELEEKKLEQVKLFKKSLLQQMFV